MSCRMVAMINERTRPAAGTSSTVYGCLASAPNTRTSASSSSNTAFSRYRNMTLDCLNERPVVLATTGHADDEDAARC